MSDRKYRKLVKDPPTLKDLDAMDSDLAIAKRSHSTRPSDITSVKARAEKIARAFEEDAAAANPADAPSGFYKNLGLPWSEMQRRLRAGAAAYREIMAEIDDWLANNAR